MLNLAIAPFTVETRRSLVAMELSIDPVTTWYSRILVKAVTLFCKNVKVAGSTFLKASSVGAKIVNVPKKQKQNLLDGVKH